MKTVALFIIGILIGSVTGFAQFRSQADGQPSVSQSLVKPNASISNFFGILNPENFQMRHSFAFNYFSGGGYGGSIASYTNSLFYKIADPLNVRFDVTLQGSPFGGGDFRQSDLSRVFLSRAELNYRPSENTFITLQFNQVPFNRYYYYDRFPPASLMFGGQ